MIIFGVIVLLAPVITILIIGRRKQHPPERHTIMPDESMNTVTDGNGANAFGNALDHPDSRYYAVNDFYNMKSEGSLHILPRFQTYQQTTEYTCGSAAALMVLNYYGNHDLNEMEIAERTKAHPNHGTSVEALAEFLQEIGYRVTYHADTTPLFATLEEFQSYVIQQIDSGIPIMVNWVDWSGHWQTIIGIDTCDTDSPYDDVLIMADSYDVTDHSGDTLKGIIYTEHPDTHVKLQGYTIPYGKEAVEMVLKAATITPQIRYVGWDVATTPTGPAIIEGNTYCAHDFWQLSPHTPDGIGMLPKIKEYIPEFFEGKIK